MPKKWTHTAAFAHFGTKPRNVQWSWSARNEATKTVVVTLWQDEFTRTDGKLVYSRSASEGKWDSRPGFKELIDNLAWAQANCDGRVKVIVALAKNKNEDPRSIAECFPSATRMRVTHLDRADGSWTLQAEGL